jgi:hypothetical protein
MLGKRRVLQIPQARLRARNCGSECRLDPLVEKFAGAAAAVQALKALFADIAEVLAGLPDAERQDAARKHWRKLIGELAEIVIDADERSLAP